MPGSVNFKNSAQLEGRFTMRFRRPAANATAMANWRNSTFYRGRIVSNRPSSSFAVDQGVYDVVLACTGLYDREEGTLGCIEVRNSNEDYRNSAVRGGSRSSRLPASRTDGPL